MRKPKAKASRKTKLEYRVDGLERIVGGLVVKSRTPDSRPLLAQLLKEAEMRAAKAEQLYNELARKLSGLLEPDQLDAARISGCAPELYAIEWIELQKERLFPSPSTLYQPFSELRKP